MCLRNGELRPAPLIVPRGAQHDACTSLLNEDKIALRDYVSKPWRINNDLFIVRQGFLFLLCLTRQLFIINR